MASIENKFACSGVRKLIPSDNVCGPPSAKSTAGMIRMATAIIAISCAKSVSTEARKPDHKVYDNTPTPAITTPAWNDKGERTETNAPDAVKLTIRLMMLPRILEDARISWLDEPCRA